MGENPQHARRLIGGIYRVGQVLTAGGVLTTCTAYNRNTNDVVGLYVVEFPSTFHPQSVQRLLHPLEQRRSLQSPHVIRVHGWGIDGSRVYIATDPPRGVTLQYVLDTENIDLQRALDLTQQMARGLQALHEHGIVGIDLRPQLITVDTVEVQDRAQLDDIGLRSLLNALGYVSGQRTSDIGYFDPRYLSPEYLGGGHIGSWSDVYHLGLLLFELTTGRLPFVGRTPAETGVMQNTSPVPRMTQYKHDAPAQLQEIVDRALAKNPAERFASAGALLAALAQLPSRAPSAKRPLPAQNAQPTSPNQPGIGLTNEMPQVEDEVTQRDPVVEDQTPLTSNDAVPTIPADQDVYAYLCYEKDGVETQQFAITQRNMIVGRLDPKRGLNPDIDLSDLDPKMTISRQHARIRFEETFFYIEDLKSRNKTHLGELTLTPLQPELVQHGDIVRFGSVRMIFKVPGMSNATAFQGKK